MSDNFYKGRLLQLKTPLGSDVLCPIGAEITEGVSIPFYIRLHMISFDTHIDPAQLLRRGMTLSIHQQKVRYFHGDVFRFEAGHIREGLREYHAILVPDGWFLSMQTDCKIFQFQSVPDIVKKIWCGHAFAELQTQLMDSYRPKEYVTQYNESDWNFMNRLLEHEGIFYTFEHEDGKHRIVLCDRSNTAPYCAENVAYNTAGNSHIMLSSFHRAHCHYSGHYIHRDFQFQTPDHLLESSSSKTPKLDRTSILSHYLYPGEFDESFTGKRLANSRFELLESQYDISTAESHYAHFYIGQSLKLTQSPQTNDQGEYFIISQTHSVTDTTYLFGNGGAQHYQTQLKLIPSHQSYRPPLVHPKPFISGPQTALVVGPKGEEIFTDEHGRIIVQFHWDRNGEYNQHSSCWIRVGQLSAGPGFGSLFLPRIGHEVIVHFLDGNPDRPIVIGSVYNGKNKSPFALPAHKTQSGFKTSSTNEIRFEDKQGEEEIFVHAQKNLNCLIENNESNSVKGNKTTEVTGFDKTISAISIIQSSEKIELKVGSSSLTISPDGVFIKGKDVVVDKGG